MRTAGYEPQVPYPGKNDIPWPSTHLVCGRKGAASYANVRKGQGACRACAVEEGGRAGVRPGAPFR